jgi:hypothetical protein
MKSSALGSMKSSQPRESGAMESSALGIEFTWEHGVEYENVEPIGIIRSTVVFLEIGWWGLMKNFYHV